MKRLLIALYCITFTMVPMFAIGEPLAVAQGDTLQSVLESQKGKRLTVKLTSGDELTGVVGTVNNSMVYLAELTGKEYFDALIGIDKIAAIIVRAK